MVRRHPERVDAAGGGSRRTPLALIGLIMALLSTSCGATCEQLKAEHDLILAGAGEPAPGPHLEMVIPFDVVNSQLEVAVGDMKSGRLVLPEFAALNAFSGGFAVQARELRIVPGQDGAIGFRVKARIRYKRKTLTKLTLRFDAPLVADREGRRLSIGLGDLRAPPEFAEDAAKKMAKTLHPLLPGPLRTVISPKRVRGICKVTLMKLEEDTYKLLRKPLVEPLLKAARIRIQMPDWPLDGLTLRTREGPRGGLVFGVTTSLRAAEPVGSALREVNGSAGIRVYLPGATAAALANHLVGRGDLPGRVNSDGNPDPDGDMAVTFGWRSGGRPLKLDLWKMSAPCASLRLGGTPTVQVVKAKASFSVPDGRLERVRGDLLVKVGAALTGLWSKVFQVEVKALRSIVMKIAGRRLRLSLEAVVDQEEGWVVVLGLAPVG